MVLQKYSVYSACIKLIMQLESKSRSDVQVLSLYQDDINLATKYSLKTFVKAINIMENPVQIWLSSVRNVIESKACGMIRGYRNKVCNKNVNLNCYWSQLWFILFSGPIY